MNEEEIPPSNDHKVPRFLLLTYAIVILWGLAAFFLYWNGTAGFPGRQTWKKLQQAAQTTRSRIFSSNEKLT